MPDSLTGTGDALPLMTREDHMPIDITRPAIYVAESKHGKTYLAAYGGSDEDRYQYVEQFLARPENAGKTVRIAYTETGDAGMKVSIDDLGTKRSDALRFWFGDLFRRPPEAPTPDAFLRRV